MCHYSHRRNFDPVRLDRALGYLARAEKLPGLSPAQRDELEAWEAAIEGSGLPVATTGGAHRRPRIQMPPPLPSGLTGERELLDLHLVERRTSPDVRRGLAMAAPAGHRIVELFDVWVGAAPLPALVIAVDYAITVRSGAGLDALRGAVARVVAAPAIERLRRKGDRTKLYDLRPFILGLRLEDAGLEAAVIRVRLAVHPELGTGRPDEVIAAISDELGQPLEVTAGERTRIWTADEALTPGLAPA
jgi:radical SAM-linked protein